MGRFIRSAAGVVKFVVVALVIGLVAAWSTAGAHPAQLGKPRALDGTVEIRAADAQRVLVAVDASNEGKKLDGKFEHLFLFTSASAVKLTPLSLAGAHLEYSNGELLVMRDGAVALQIRTPGGTASSAPVRPGGVVLDDPIGLSHYAGPFGTTRDDLGRVTRSDACESACFRIGSREIEFPF